MEPIRNNEDRKEIQYDISPINASSQLCFHINRAGNGNDDNLSISEEHFANSKTRRGI